MLIVVDNPSDLANDSFQQELFFQASLQAYILESDWRNLPLTTQSILAPFLIVNKIVFIPLTAISFLQVHTLRKFYGTGISIEALTMLAFCKQYDGIFHSQDPALLKIARELDITDYFDLKEYATYKSLKAEKMKKIWQKKSHEVNRSK